jgi:hypothetical protein
MFFAINLSRTIEAIREPLFPSPNGLATALTRSVQLSGLTASFNASESSEAEPPTSLAMPQLIASGRSVFFRSTSNGLPNVGASSCTPPESETMSHAERNKQIN